MMGMMGMMRNKRAGSKLMFFFSVCVVWCVGLTGVHAEPLSSEDPDKKPVYPWRTRFFVPYSGSSVLLPFLLDEDYGTGGELESGVLISPVLRDPTGLGMSAGYRFFRKGLVIPYLGLGAAYHFGLFDQAGVVASAGVNFTFPIDSEVASFAPELYTETQIQFHLHSRHLLYVNVGLNIPFTSTAPPAFSLGFGIKKSHPVMLRLKELQPKFGISPERFSPDGDGDRDILKIHTKIAKEDAVKRWVLRVYDPKGHLFYTEKGKGAPPNPILWQGRSRKNELVSSASTYTVQLQVTDVLDRTVELRDEVLIDILVVRENGKLKIRIPNITFPPNSADFSLLSSEEVIEKNRDVLNKLVKIFADFPEYSIVIEGHANMEHYYDTEKARREQQRVLIPLSLKRAQAVKEVLVELGMDPDRLSTVGLGAQSPVVPFSNEQDRWKNRRVEFILQKAPSGENPS